jgi:excinuclease ABC subunit C
MAHENAKLLYQEAKKRTGVSESEEVQKALDLAECPHSIEGIDVSNLQGTNPAIALVHFADERPLKSRYRLYYPKTVEGQDDFAMIYEVVTRRFSKHDPPPPDLLLIDGGKGQLAAAERALKDVGRDIPLCSLAKARTESAFTRKEVNKSEERIFLPGRKNPVLLKEGHPALRLLQRVRDEAHRFSVKSHRIRRKKSSFKEGHLDSIPGIGEKTKAKLLQLFGGPTSIASATLEQLVEAGLTDKQARAVKEYFDNAGLVAAADAPSLHAEE